MGIFLYITFLRFCPIMSLLLLPNVVKHSMAVFLSAKWKFYVKDANSICRSRSLIG